MYIYFYLKFESKVNEYSWRGGDFAFFFFYWIVYSNNEANLFRETSSGNNNRGYAMAEDKWIMN